jgi:large subunit ribosomal protein L3
MTLGIIGKKIGTTRIFADDGKVIPVTVVEAGPCVITQVKTATKEGYEAIQLGFKEAKKLNRPQKGHLKKLGMFRHLREFRVKDSSTFERGQSIKIDLFKNGEFVDVTGVSKGRGFAGVVKRYGFAGGPKTHGQSDRHRAPGSIGSGTSPGRVLKGIHMAGHMGNRRVTVKNLEIVKADAEKNLLLIKGAVPGARDGLLLVKKARGQ